MSERLPSIDAHRRRPRGSIRAGAASFGGGRREVAIFSSGRVVWLRLTPSLARVAEVNALRVSIARAEERRSESLVAQQRKLSALRTTVAADTRQLSRAQVSGDRALGAQVLKGYEQGSAKITRAFEDIQSRADDLRKRQSQALSRLGRRALWDDLVVISALPLFAAYGRRGTPFASNNLALGALLGVWLVGDKVTDLLSGTKPPEGGVRGTDLWSYVAPAANVMIGWLLFRNQQHERFVDGIADSFGPPTIVAPGGPVAGGLLDVVYVYAGTFSLSDAVAAEHFDDFASYKSVAAVASIGSYSWSPDVPTAIASAAQFSEVTASVFRGELTLSLSVTVQIQASPPLVWPNVLPTLKIAWIVDTQEPSAS